MKTNEFDYYLPEELIASHPLEKRSDSRLLVYHKKTKTIEHKHFYDLTSYLRKGDMLVFNSTKVIPARIFGVTEHGGKVELLLLKEVDKDTWECLVKPGRKAKVGTAFTFSKFLTAKCLKKEDAVYTFKLDYEGNLYEILDKIGVMPLPPYIKRKLEDPNRYQTVYAKELGSIAAPTAGLHFTKELLENLINMGVSFSSINLEVGLGTFRPVEAKNLEEHVMHHETFHITEENSQLINEQLKRDKRLILTGTTVVRALESAYNGEVKSGDFDTNIFIYPGYEFKTCKNLITNFHLPKSTLIMLVSALIGKDETMRIYKEAVKERYRFFSFGDAMLILDD